MTEEMKKNISEDEKKQFDAYVDYAKTHMCDMIPYNDPNYEEKLQNMAESYAEMELYGYPPELLDLCKEHDEWLKTHEEPSGPHTTNNITDDFLQDFPW